jgi:serine/arginine repetitive matrix protein 2
MGFRPSDGQLNTDFKFGVRPRGPQIASEPKQEKPITLSDIIPPLSHTHSLSSSSMMDDDSVLKLVFAKAADIPTARVRVDLDSSSKRRVRDFSRTSGPSTDSRCSSGVIFAGFESFEEVRRGFEFNNNRPAFYPPSGATWRDTHGRQGSLFSIASVSSYGRVTNPGSTDTFDYSLPSLRERPSAEDVSVSMSMTVLFPGP